MTAARPSAVRRSPRRPRRPLRALACALAVLLLAACAQESDGDLSTQAAPAASSSRVELATPPPLQSDDRVDLTVYYRAGQGPTAHLEPVVAEVPVVDDLPRRALELLLDGPGEEHTGLEAPLPTSTEVVDLDVEGGTARVLLSADVVGDAASVGASPANEALALAALANTLTEFTSIERVVVGIEGQEAEAVRAFWGGWGLPEVLVRDESLVGDVEGEGAVDLNRFSEGPQAAGAEGGPAVRVTSVRVRDRITSTRLVLELADAEDADAAVKAPPVRARRTPQGISVVLTQAVALDGETGELLDVDPEQFPDARVDLDPATGRLEVLLRPAEPREFWLHTLSSPTRIVLDVKK